MLSGVRALIYPMGCVEDKPLVRRKMSEMLHSAYSELRQSILYSYIYYHLRRHRRHNDLTCVFGSILRVADNFRWRSHPFICGRRLHRTPPASRNVSRRSRVQIVGISSFVFQSKKYIHRTRIRRWLTSGWLVCAQYYRRG